MLTNHCSFLFYFKIFYLKYEQMQPFPLLGEKQPVWFKLSPSNLGTLNTIPCLLFINPLCQISQFHSATLMFWMILKNGSCSSKKVKKKKGKEEKSVVYRSQLLWLWRQQLLILLFYARNPHCPHWHRYN